MLRHLLQPIRRQIEVTNVSTAGQRSTANRRQTVAGQLQPVEEGHCEDLRLLVIMIMIMMVMRVTATIS